MHGIYEDSGRQLAVMHQDQANSVDPQPRISRLHALLGDIFEHLDDATDADTLRSCSLVWKAWHLPAHARLFHTIALTTADACARLQRVVTTRPRLLAFVRELHINFSRRPIGALGWLIMPNLHTVRLISYPSLKQTYPPLEELAPLLGTPTIAHVDLRGNPSQIVRYLDIVARCRAAELGRLNICVPDQGGTTTPEQEGEQPQFPPHRIKVGGLAISGAADLSNALVFGPQGYVDLSAVTALEFGCLDYESHSTFLAQHGQLLIHLTIIAPQISPMQVSLPRTFDPEQLPLDTTTLPVLTELTINAITAPSLIVVQRWLSTARRLRHVVLNLVEIGLPFESFFEPSGEYEAHLRAIDATLGGIGLVRAELRLRVGNCTGNAVLGAQLEALRALFPVLGGQRVLVVRVE
ncbi:hypothetical protein C8F04DRAFT_627602 [Mycena alexandri]|uniref:Uncharacterized protein n=1 Tax=Mycena alexandri TaxID=1745969 RepID=A0AAD6SSI3_9AGAR|nr:hypothetical protein C8F04DRAFT_627602 [Mycena alexandri]